jgi:hypothetical protein
VENKNVEDIPLSLERQKNKIDALTPITKINIHEVTTKNEPFLI